MTIENPTIKPDIDKRKKIALERIFMTKINWYIDEAIEENQNIPIGFEIYLKGLGILLNMVKERIPCKGAELSGLYDLIASSPTENREEFARSVSLKLSEFMLANYSFDEIENMDRQGKSMINRLIEYKIDHDEVSIHVPITFLEDSSERFLLLADAMKKLASKLKNDPEFKDVKRIFAKSWMVLKLHEDLEKKFGFTILSLEPESNTASAEISKEKLIEMYGE